MKICPVQSFTQTFKCKSNTNKENLSFEGKMLKKEMQEIGDKYINESKQAKNRKEFYSVAKSYLKEGLIPALDNQHNIKKEQDNSKLKNEVINQISSDIELSFDPDLMILQENIKHLGLKDERKHFLQIVKNVNKIIENWKENK